MKGSTPEVELEKCTGCGDCVDKCPSGAVKLVEGKAVVIRPEDCDYCTECETFCPSGAIRCPFEIILLQAEPERPPAEHQPE